MSARNMNWNAQVLHHFYAEVGVITNLFFISFKGKGLAAENTTNGIETKELNLSHFLLTTIALLTDRSPSWSNFLLSHG